MSELILGAGGGGGGGGKGGGGGGGTRTPTTAGDNLDSTQYATLIDLISEGEISGLKDGLKSIFIDNTPLVNVSAVIKSGTFSQASGTLTVSITAHGYTAGTVLVLEDSAGAGAITNTYTVATAAANTFTCTAKNNTSVSGSLTATLASNYNFKNITVWTRNGIQTQPPIPITDGEGNAAIQSEVGVGVEVLKDVPVIRTITDSDVDAARVTVTLPALQRFEDNGDISGTSVELQIAIQYNGGGFTTLIADTITGRSGDQYQRDYVVSLSGAFPVNIKVTRITDDSNDPKISNSLTWTSYTELTYANLSYPNSALVGIRVDADQFSSIPARSYLIKGIKVVIPSNATVDSATGALIYTGVWNGTFGAAAWTTDPCWILWDLLVTKRYGFGDQIQASQLDKWAFYSASVYASALNTRPSGSTDDYNATTGKHGVADGFGGYEPRFSCNVNIQTQEDAFKLINDLVSVFCAQAYWSTGALTISQDKPTDPAYLFTLANVAEGGFSYQNSSQKTRPTVAVVSYLDLNSRNIAVEAVEDKDAISKYGVIKEEISAFACTSRGQAYRLGKWLLYANIYENEVIIFTASIDAGVVVRPGQIIAVADPMRGGSRRGGRINSSTTTVVTLDDVTGLTMAGAPTLSVILSDGTVQTRNVASISGNAITVSTAFGSVPNANSIWVYETNDLQTSTWRVLGVQEQDGGVYAVTAIAYNSSKYAYIEDGAELQFRDTTNLNVLPVAPTNIAVTEALYTYQTDVRAKIIVTWTGIVGVNVYEIRWRKNDGNWTVNTVRSPDYEILNITPGVFDFKIYSLSPTSEPSTTFLSGSITALGKTAPPADVTSLTFNVDAVLGVTLNWANVTDLDLDTYEIRRGTSWGSSTYVTQTKSTSYKIGYLDDGTYTYLVKAIDTSQVYSTNPASVAVTISGPPATTLTQTISGTDLVLSWTVPTLGTYAIDYYRVTYGNNYATSAELTKSQTTSFTVPITWIGSRTFYVAPVDMVGKFTDPPASIVVTITGAGAPTITATVGGNTATLSWTAVAGTLPTTGYEIRQGATFATATVLANITGTSYTLKATWSGAQTFWVVAKDVNNTYGTQASATITINAAGAPTLSASFAGQNTVFAWNAIKGTLDTDYYLLKRGASWAAGTTVATIYSTAYTLKADWGGTETFWLAAVDINGTEGTPVSLNVTVTIPTAPTITQQVIDNNVLLRWNDVTQTLPILNYELRKGASWAAGTVIGTKQGGFTTVFETAAGSYTYWLAGLDSANKYGTPGSVTALVNQPPDYVLKLDYGSTWTGTKTNIVTGSTGQLVNVNTTETWTTHFTSSSWTTPQDQITAGYPYFLMPSTTTASYEEEIDYGTLLAGTKISSILTNNVIAGSTIITPTLRVRGTSTTAGTYSQTTTTITVTSATHGLLAGDYVYLNFTTGTATTGTYVVVTAATNTFTVTSATSTTTSGNVSWIKWTTYTGLSEVFVTSFRYFRVRYDFASVGGNDLLQLTALNVRLDSKLRNDSGTGTANSADSGGTTVNFNVAFVDVDSISVTPSATTAVIAVYDFVDAPNPTSFKVLLYNTSGTRVSGGFSWSARGV